jgi:hypothetical protein
MFEIADFVGYILFFVALFYVAHALYIMGLSVITSSHYEKLHALSIAEVLQEYTKLENTLLGNIYWILSPFSVSSAQRNVEFKIIYALFRDTYWLPSDFDFGAYLSGCLARYSQRIINIGVYSWLFMIFLALFNLMRVRLFGDLAFGCHASGQASRKSNSQFYSFLNNPNCDQEHTYLFLAAGFSLCLYTSILLWLGQVYSRR